jgi:hypothetical protein
MPFTGHILQFCGLLSFGSCLFVQIVARLAGNASLALLAAGTEA